MFTAFQAAACFDSRNWAMQPEKGYGWFVDSDVSSKKQPENRNAPFSGCLIIAWQQGLHAHQPIVFVFRQAKLDVGNGFADGGATLGAGDGDFFAVDHKAGNGRNHGGGAC